MTPEMIQGLLVWYLVFLFSTTFHEFSHAFLALKGGDPTAYETGHVTLDPTPHIRRSPTGMLLLPILSYLKFGWMLGFASVPFNPEWGRRHPLKQALMSLAGPMANLLLALFALGMIRLLLSAHVFQFATTVGSDQYVEAVGAGARSPLAALALGLSVMLKLNVALCLFNLIPLPPLDGSGVLSGFFPGSLGALYDKLTQLPGYELLGLVVAWKVFPLISAPAFRFVESLLSG